MMKPQTIGDLAAKGFVVLFALILLIPSTCKLYAYWSFRSHGISAEGVIDTGGGRDLGGRPIIAFKDVQGNRHEFKTKAKTHWFFKPVKGETIRIFYLADDPDKAMADSISYHVIIPLAFFCVGLLVVIYLARNGLAASAH